MIEFTLSRVVLCVCGMAILVVVSGAFSASSDSRGMEMCEELSESVAVILDRFEGSSSETMELHGSDLIPDDAFTVSVRDYVVTASYKGRSCKSPTTFGGSFELDHRSTVVLTK